MDYTSTIPYESTTCPGVSFEIAKPSQGRNVEFNRANAAFRQEARTLQKQINANHKALQDHAREWQRTVDGKYLLAQKAVAANGEDTESRDYVARVDAGREIEKLRLELSKVKFEDNEPEDSPASLRVKELIDQITDLEPKAELYREPEDLLEERTYLRFEGERLMEEKYRATRLKWGLKSLSGLTIDGQPASVDNLLKAGPPDLAGEILGKIEEVSQLSPELLKKSSLPTTSNAAEGGSENSTTATDVKPENSTKAATAVNITLS